MASFAAAQAPSILPAAPQSDEADAQVERVIKAAMELPIDETPALDLRPKTISPNSNLYLGGHLVNLTGESRPEDTLLGEIPTLAFGPRVESDVRIDSYRLGYRYPIKLGPQTAARWPVSIHSLAGVAVLDATYESESPQGLVMERGFFKGAPLMGGEVEWRATRTFSLAGELTSTLPLSSMPFVFSAQVLARYQLVGHPEAGVRAFTGVGYERIFVEDRDDVISNINSDSGPMLIIGIEARY